MNKDLLYELCHKYYNKETKKFRRNKIFNEYNKREMPITISQLKNYLIRDFKIDESLLSNDNQNHNKVENKESITSYADGSKLYEKLIALHKDDLNDDITILKAFNLNPNYWIITSSVFNLWSTDTHDGRLNNYQAKVKVAPKKLNDISNEDVVDSYNKIRKKPIVKYNHNVSDKVASVYLSDLHIGSNEFCVDNYKRMIEANRSRLISENVSEIHINFLGDILHYDNDNKTTNRGTQLESKLSPKEMIDLATEIIDYTIERLSFTDCHIHWVQGNHSRLLEYKMFEPLPRFYANSNHITFDVDFTRRKGYLIFDTLIAIAHGDMATKNMYSWVQYEFNYLWSSAKWYELHTGHLHELMVKTVGGLTHTQHGIQLEVGKNTYASNLGYNNLWGRVQTNIYQKGLGLINTMYN